jgi:hypothetical protein
VGFRDAAKIALQKRDAGTLHGDIGARAHRDSDGRFGQSGRVVDAVSGHRNDFAAALQIADDVALLRGQHFGPHIGDAQGACHGLGGRPAVARQHDDLDTLGLEGAQGFLRRGLDPIRNAEKAGCLAVYRNEHDGLTLTPQILGAR